MFVKVTYTLSLVIADVSVSVISTSQTLTEGVPIATVAENVGSCVVVLLIVGSLPLVVACKVQAYE